MDEARYLRRQELEFLDTLKAALKLYLHNLNFIVFTLFTSIPLFALLVYYEVILHSTLYEVSEFLSAAPRSLYYVDGSRSDGIATRLTRETLPKIIQLFLLYLVPCYLLDLFSLILTVGSASDLIGAEEKPTSLWHMILKALKKARFKGPFITSLYVHLFSICTLVGLMWLVVNHQVLSRSGFGFPFLYWDSYYGPRRGYFVQVVLGLVHGVAFMALLMKYMDWSAEWNMGLVVSILEDSYGSEAMEVSATLIKGNHRKGAFLMSVFLLWGLCLRLPCLYGKCSESNGGVLVIGVSMCLVCVGNVLKWTTCLLYFSECKKGVMEKKFDEEDGKRAVQATLQENIRIGQSEAEAVGSA